MMKRYVAVGFTLLVAAMGAWAQESAEGDVAEADEVSANETASANEIAPAEASAGEPEDDPAGAPAAVEGESGEVDGGSADEPEGASTPDGAREAAPAVEPIEAEGAEEDNTAGGDPPVDPTTVKGAIVLNPVGLLLGTVLGLFELTVEVQLLSSDVVAFVLTPDVFFGSSGVFGIGLEAGVQFLPMRGGIEGFYIALQPGVFIVSAAGYGGLAVSTSASAGYQWVSDRGFVFKLGGGARYMNVGGYGTVSPWLVIGFGFAL